LLLQIQLHNTANLWNKTALGILGVFFKLKLSAYRRVQGFLEMTMPQVFSDWENISETTLEKFFLAFSSFWGFESKNLKNG
jgi:hypothetical protein